MKNYDMMTDMAEVMEGRFFGKYRGIVKDNRDPTQRGCLKVLVPAVMDQEAVWAMPCIPYSGDNMGFHMIPEAGTGVWVEFEAGDPSYPIWVGCYWADQQVPQNQQGTPATPPIKILRSQQGLIVSLDDGQQAITLSDKNGNNLVTLQVQQGQVTVKGAQKVVVEAPQIELVKDSIHPVVFGDRLLQYLNTLVQLIQGHTHIGSTSPPAAPFPPPTSTLISNRVKTG